ncbi:MAG: hypothetical protein RL481_1302 [Pseudomonadota bacterium]
MPCGISFRFPASGSPTVRKDRRFTKLLSVSRPALASAVRLQPALDGEFSCSNLLFLLLALAHMKRSDPVSGLSAFVPSLSRRSAFSHPLLCLTNRKSHLGLSRTTEISRVIHRLRALRWIKKRTKGSLLFARNFRTPARNIRTNEDGLHAGRMKAVRYDGRAGGEEERCPSRQISEATVPLPLSCKWRFVAFCAIAKRTRVVARNATGNRSTLSPC